MIKNILIACFLITCAGAFLYFGYANADNAKGDNINTVSIISSDGKEHIFDVELALSEDEQAKGLMHRESLAQNAGMLFVFGEEKDRGFYMKNTLIPLDMIFIKKDGVIRYVHENAIPHDESTILSNGPVYAVLEINGGLSAMLGIKAGDTVHSKFFNNEVR